jgi:hypothetical protein
MTPSRAENTLDRLQIKPVLIIGHFIACFAGDHALETAHVLIIGVAHILGEAATLRAARFISDRQARLSRPP